MTKKGVNQANSLKFGTEALLLWCHKDIFSANNHTPMYSHFGGHCFK